jgi:transcriptional regulator with XRE-family HTH domain
MSPRRVQLAARRKAAGYSQEGLAHKIGVTVSAVSRWELGTSTPRANLRRPLAAALDLSPPELEHLLFEHACEASYGAPEYGGNRELAGWRMIGYAGDVQPRGWSDAEVTGA